MNMTTSSVDVDVTAAETAPTAPPKHPAFRHQFYPRLLRAAQYLVAIIPIINFISLGYYHSKLSSSEIEHLTTGDYPPAESIDAWWHWLDADNKNIASPQIAFVPLIIAFFYSGLLSTLADRFVKSGWYKAGVPPKMGQLETKLARLVTPFCLTMDTILAILFTLPVLQWSQIAHSYSCTGRMSNFRDDGSRNPDLPAVSRTNTPIATPENPGPAFEYVWSENVEDLRNMWCIEGKVELFVYLIAFILYSISALTTIRLIYQKRHAASAASMDCDKVDIEAVGAEEKDVEIEKVEEDLIQL
ncbi:hypothetical protein DFH27DRAFT_551127 [Peziza echinospora]|nr:hypothetical protein DFH27DRAFT_551127 [Peziza echinospora]